MLLKLHELIKSSSLITVKIASSAPINKKFGSEIIKWYQNTEYSHVLVILNDMVFQANHHGVVTESMDFFLKENKILDCIEINKEKCDFEFLFYGLGKPYGFMQIFKIALKYLFMTKLKILKAIRIKDQSAKSLICSQYVGKFLKLDWTNDYTDPEDIMSYLLTIKK